MDDEHVIQVVEPDDDDDAIARDQSRRRRAAQIAANINPAVWTQAHKDMGDVLRMIDHFRTRLFFDQAANIDPTIAEDIANLKAGMLIAGFGPWLIDK